MRISSTVRPHLTSLTYLSYPRLAAANQLEDPYHFIPLFDATKTAMGHLSIVKQDYNTMRNATGGARERERVTSTSAD